MSTPPGPRPPHGHRFGQSLRDFWQQVTEGARLSQLYHQFVSEARTSYGLYSREVDWDKVRAEKGWKRPFRAAWALFIVFLMKLSPARRVLLLLAIAFLLWPRVEISGHAIISFDTGDIGITLLFVLLALELADRVTMKRDLEIARDIQHRLLPDVPPSVPGWQIAFRTRPANTVGGDYYDAFARPGTNGRMIVAVADVAGKSVPAALLMATFQASLEALAALPGTVADVARGLNRYSCAHSLNGMRFTTAFLAEFDPSSGAADFVNAGHNAPFLLRSSGAIERLEATAVPFGIVPGSEYSSQDVSIGPGDTLVVFSDGVVEAVNDRGEEYGEGRLRDVFMRLHGADARNLLEAVFFDVDRYVAQARQHDDITCLVLRRE